MISAQKAIRELTAELDECRKDGLELRKALVSMRETLRESQAVVREQAARLELVEEQHGVS